jgi:hypothetical protein
VSSVVAVSGTLNFVSSLLYGTATRNAIYWQLNATGTTQLNGTGSAPNPWTGPVTKTGVPATGTVNYYLRIPTGTGSSGWSTNNSSGLSGSFYATITWRNVGTQVVDVAAVACTVSYTA